MLVYENKNATSEKISLFCEKTRKDPAEPRLLAIFHAMLSFANCITARELTKQFFHSLPIGPR